MDQQELAENEINKIVRAFVLRNEWQLNLPDGRAEAKWYHVEQSACVEAERTVEQLRNTENILTARMAWFSERFSYHIDSTDVSS
jgi:hypothetical protein